MIYIDAGSTYAKYYNDETKEKGVINIREFRSFIDRWPVDVATGHSAKVFKPKLILNELVVLKEAVSELGLDSFTVVDVGSRDIKLVKYKDSKFETCDWNTACGAMVGFTVDLLMKYFKIDIAELKYINKSVDVTCGLLGITRFFDEIARGDDIASGFTMLINGMAKFTYNFAGKPSTLFLSGGMSENHIFVSHLKTLMGENAYFVSLGRFSLIDGMVTYIKKQKKTLSNVLEFSNN